MEEKANIFKLSTFKLQKKYHLLKLQYQINKSRREKLRLFGESFVNRNKSKYIIIYNNQKYEMKEFFEYIYKGCIIKDSISIKLIVYNNIIHAKYMFKECNSLLSISDIKNENKKFNVYPSIKLRINNKNNDPDIKKKEYIILQQRINIILLI